MDVAHIPKRHVPAPAPGSRAVAGVAAASATALGQGAAGRAEIITLVDALEAKDCYTAGHAREIAGLAVAAGMRLGLDEDELDDLRYGATFHDIGKIAIPEAILNKPGPLSDEERELVRRHTVIGEEIIAPVGLLAGARPIVRSNHERWDGSGYPDALAGEEIPIGARIVAAVDSYHAMTSDRAYHAAIAPAEAIAELRRCAGSQLDPRVVEAVIELLEDETGEGT